eukprot:6180829-Pleurochrysis_carterae.AAC.1
MEHAGRRSDQPLPSDRVTQCPHGLTRTPLAEGTDGGGALATSLPDPLQALARARHRLWRQYACCGLPNAVGWVDPMQPLKTMARGAPVSAVRPDPTVLSPLPGDHLVLRQWWMGGKMSLAAVLAGCVIVRGLARVLH